MKKCPKCNTEFAWGTGVCPSCGKKVKNPKVEIHLKNQAGQECKVSCSEKIKMNFGQMYLELRFGIPALNVKPVKASDVVITFALFLSIWLFPVVFQNGFGLFMCLAMLVVNVIYTMNFYFNAIKRKLQEGYVPADDDTAAILQNAGLGLGTSSFATNQNFQNPANTEGASFCAGCGTRIESEAKFCPKCGKPMLQTEKPASTSKIKTTSNSEKTAIDTSQDTPVDPMAQIEKLGALMEKGLLSKEEFEAQKAKLLSLA